MELDRALDEYTLMLRRRHPGEDARAPVLALSALREYLLDYCGHLAIGDVRPADLEEFLYRHYPEQEQPDSEVGRLLATETAGFARWLLERGARGLAPFVEDEDRIQSELPRVLTALELLREHTAEEDLPPPLGLGDEEDGEVATIGSGVSRVVRPERVDYARAVEDHFELLAVETAGLTLQSEPRRVLGEPPASPVRVPAAAAGQLRRGDTIHAEIAPADGAWELLEVFSVRPGGRG